MEAIIKREPQWNARDARERFIFGMFLLYATRPSKASPELDGSHYIGEVGSAPEKDWTKATPYSLARKLKHGFVSEDFGNSSGTVGHCGCTVGCRS